MSLGIFSAALALVAWSPLRAEVVRVRPAKQITLDPAQVEAIAKSRGWNELPPEVQTGLLAAKEQAFFHKLKSELQQAAFVLKNEKYDGPLKDSLAFAKSKGCALEELQYAHYLIQNAESAFTGEALPFISIAIGQNKITIQQDGSTKEIP